MKQNVCGLFLRFWAAAISLIAILLSVCGSLIYLILSRGIRDMGNLTSPKFPEDKMPSEDVLHPDGLVLGGLREPDFSRGLNMIADGSPRSIDDRAVAPGPSADGEGFYTGLSPYTPDPDSKRLFQRGLNGKGYIPKPGDANLLARLIFAEGAGTPQDMDALGWAAVNRVGDREFGQTLDRVLHRRNAFEPVQANSPLWRASAKPQNLTGPNAAAWQRAQATAEGILGGILPDPINGAPYFFSWARYNGYPNTAPPGFQGMLRREVIAPVFPLRDTGTTNYFLNRNPYPPKNDLPVFLTFSSPVQRMERNSAALSGHSGFCRVSGTRWTETIRSGLPWPRRESFRAIHSSSDGWTGRRNSQNSACSKAPDS